MDRQALLLALLYHAHHRKNMEDLPFWLSLADSQPGPFLELGCGTGRILLPLAQTGKKVTGLDSSAEMLFALQKNTPPELQASIQLIRVDMTRLCMSQLYRMILLPCNTYSTLTPLQRQDLLSEVRSHLAGGGLFAVSMPNPVLLTSLPSRSRPQLEDDFPHPLDGEPVQVSSGWQRTSSEFTIFWHYDHLLPDGTVRRYSTQVSHKLTRFQDYLDEIAQSGLSVVETYGDYDRSRYTPQSNQLILIVARAN